ncbi:hypothetical protein [Gordonia malaquae]|uniref:hypothetical protein n=1 Tax=Gordonia malaquae TaxID=410332 RepID=UPI0030FDFD1E
MSRPDNGRGPVGLLAALALVMALCVGCAQAPGGPVGELVTSTESARSGVLTAMQALSEWHDNRLPSRVTAVTVDDALSSTYDAVGVVVALDVETARDDERRIDVQQQLSRAVDAVVRARRVLNGDRDASAVPAAIDDLGRVGAELDGLAERMSS